MTHKTKVRDQSVKGKELFLGHVTTPINNTERVKELL